MRAGRAALRTFDGAVTIVTGAASGIGRALAEELARRGSEVVLADRQHDLATQVAAEIVGAGGRASAAPLDVTDATAVEDLVRATYARTGRLDYLFNNAGIGIAGDAWRHRLQDWEAILDVNLRGVIHGVQAAYPRMCERGFGHIVNTSSMAGLVPFTFEVAYVTTKYAVVGLSTALRAEAPTRGVRVSVICPGVVRTPILKGGGRYGRMLVDVPPEVVEQWMEPLRPMAVSVFARKALSAVGRNKAIIVIPAWWKLFWWLNRLSPTLGIALAERTFRTNLKRLRTWQER